MFLIIKNFDNNNIFLSEKQKNTILPSSDFYRIYYSCPDLTMNGIFLEYDIYNISIQKYFNKIKCLFDKIINNDIISKILKIENNILSKFNDHIEATPENIIEDQLKQGFIKIFTEKNIEYGKYKKINLILKISGIWVQNKKFGLTFRFLINHRQ